MSKMLAPSMPQRAQNETSFAGTKVRDSAYAALVRGEVLYVRRARLSDLPVINGMISDAKARLRQLGTDQWSTDWVDKKGRKRTDRVINSIIEGKTWICVLVLLTQALPKVVPVATVTIEETTDPVLWHDLVTEEEAAVCLHRLVTAEGFSGLHIGSSLIDWAGKRGMREYSARSIRIDVWTTNEALHNYYEKQGFEPCGLAPESDCPARARFQRPTSFQKGDGPAIVELTAPYEAPQVSRDHGVTLRSDLAWPAVGVSSEIHHEPARAAGDVNPEGGSFVSRNVPVALSSNV